MMRKSFLLVALAALWAGSATATAPTGSFSGKWQTEDGKLSGNVTVSLSSAGGGTMKFQSKFCARDSVPVAVSMEGPLLVIKGQGSDDCVPITLRVTPDAKGMSGQFFTSDWFGSVTLSTK